MDIITSSSNQIVKYVKSLYLKKIRDEHKEFVVEGLRFSKEAFDSGWKISKVIVSESFYKQSENLLFDSEPVIVSDKLFNEISETERPQGIMAIVKMPEDVRLPQKGSKVILLDCLQDPGNMGTIIRTADAFGINAIVASDGCVDIYNGKVLRATMGSIFHIPVIKSDNVESAIIDLKNAGFQVYASHLKGCDLKRGVPKDKDRKTAVIIGNEANGISEGVASLADKLVKIPMAGKAESLNASIAAAILMYEMF